jgi:hypothetical protein
LWKELSFDFAPYAISQTFIEFVVELAQGTEVILR